MNVPSSAPRLDLSRRSFHALVLVAVLVATLWQLTLLHRGVLAVSADSSARILNAYHWTQDPSPRALVWPPLFRMVVGSALLVWPDLLVTPRVVVFVSGLAAILLVAWLTLALFGSRRAAAVAALLAAVLPERVVLALVPLVEMLYFVPALLGLLLLWLWLKSGRPGQAMGAAAGFAVACSARYEGWFLALAAAALVCWVTLVPARRAPLVAAAVVAVCAAFPCYWVGLHLVQHGNLDWITQASGPRYQLLHGDSFLRLAGNSAPVQFLAGNAASLNLVGVLALIPACRRRPRLRRWITVPAAALVLISVLALAGTALPSHNFWRIPALWSLLLVPFTAHWLVTACGRLGGRRRWAGAAMAVVAIVAVGSAGALRIGRLTRKPSFGPHELRMARELEAVLSGGEDAAAVLIDTSTMRYFHIQVASQHPDAFVLNTGRDPRKPARAGLVRPAAGTLDLASIRELGIGHLVFRNPRAVEILQQEHELEQVAASGPWRLFAVRGIEAPQRMSDAIRPEQVRYRSGFYRDFNWTTGHSTLEHMAFEVPAKHRFLVIHLHRVHPLADDIHRLGAAVWANGVALEPAGGDRSELRFRLPPSISEIHTLTIDSATFVPGELRGTDDTRHLGLPIESITTAP